MKGVSKRSFTIILFILTIFTEIKPRPKSAHIHASSRILHLFGVNFKVLGFFTISAKIRRRNIER